MLFVADDFDTTNNPDGTSIQSNDDGVDNTTGNEGDEQESESAFLQQTSMKSWHLLP